MRRQSRPVLAALVLGVMLALLCSVLTVHAEDYLGEVVNGLKNSPVYIAPDTEGTDVTTAGQLSGQLNSKDNIVLVMLPQSAQAGLGESSAAFAAQVSSKIGNRRIIGLAVGQQTVAYAPSMPAGVADDLMNRASSVSNDPVTALETFARNVHQWQSDHPEAKTTGQALSQHSGGLPWFIWVMIVLVVLIIGVVAYMVLLAPQRQEQEYSSELNIRFDSTDPVRGDLRTILDLRSQVDDKELQEQLTQICADVDAYFQRLRKNGGDWESSTQTFRHHLDSVRNVLERYIDIQNHPRYYDDPKVLMQRGRVAINEFGTYVLNEIKRGGKKGLTNFRVDTDILSATRYS